MAIWGSLVLDQLTPSNRKANGQGYFRYYRPDGTFDAIVAVGGKLIRNGGDLPITGLPDGFQTTRMVEAVQWGTKMYIATGTDLVCYDGTTAAVVTPYKPEPMEALYIGTNGLAANPDNFLQDGTAVNLQLAGVTVDKRKGVVNTPSVFTAYVNKPAGMNVKYFFQYKLKAADTYLPTTVAYQTSNIFTFTPDRADEYMLKVSVLNQTSPDTDPPASQYFVPGYVVTPYNQNDVIDTSAIHTCNRILLHWERLILYGDTVNKNLIYISDIKKADYFPTNNTLAFESDQNEPITKLVQFRDIIVAFLPSSIQGLLGKGPTDYARVKLNTGIGCVAPETAKVLDNTIMFLSKDGVYSFRANTLDLSRGNVERMDRQIMNIIPPYPDSSDACAVVFESQYHLCFPNIKKRFRFYEVLGTWTKDESIYFDIGRFEVYRGDLVIQSQSTGEVYQFDDDIYADLEHVYESVVETKSYDFGQPYHPKKLKELQVMVGHERKDTNLSVTVYGDSTTILSPDESFPSIEDGEIRWNTAIEDNIKSASGTILGEWQIGVDPFGEIDTQFHKLRLLGGSKYHSAKVRFAHREAKPFRLIGLGFIFKLKRV